MSKLGGRKFLGFVVLSLLGLVAATKGVSLDTGVVTLLLGAYGIFAASNTANLMRSAPSDVSSPLSLLQTPEFEAAIVAHLNQKVGPVIQQLTASHQQLNDAVTKVVEHVSAAPNKAQANRDIMQQIINGQSDYTQQG